MFSFLSFSFFFILALSSLVSAALQNVTIDDQDLSKIDYEQARYWAHDPLIGYEFQFNNGSRSYTWTPGAYASFTFTGSGIYLQGPFAPDQALRRVWLDGQDMGQFGAYAEERSQCTIYWGKGDLVFTTHTVVVAHNDSASKIFAVDAFIVEFDPLQTPLPYSTTTVTTTTTATTITLTSTVTSDPNAWADLSKHRSYSNVIIGIVVPVLLLFLFCIVGFCIYRNRRSRNRQRRRDSFREKLFRARGKFYMQNSAVPWGSRRSTSNSMDERPTSPRTIHTIASTQYETAPDHTVESMSRHFHSNNRNLMDIREPSPIQHGVAIHPTLLPSTVGHSIANHTPNSSMAVSGEYLRRNSFIRPTFVPPAEWRTTLTSPLSTSPAFDLNTDSDEASSPVRVRSPYRQGSLPSQPPSAWLNTSERAHHVANRPSTVFSETDSNFSAPVPAAAAPTTTRSQTPRDPQHANSVFRRLSAALTSPFARAPSRASTFMSSARNSMQQNNAAAPRTSENSGPGYFRGVNHFNLGIPLNYRPVASQSPTEAVFGRISRGIDRTGDQEGSNSLGRSSAPSTPIRPGSGIDDLAIYGYTQNLRTKGAARASTDRPSTERTLDEDDEKPEKILENFDGSTMRESASGHNRNGSWSVGHGTFASQGDENGASNGTGDLGRTGSLSSRQRSFRSRNGQATPPPYTVVIPPDTKATPD